VGTRGGGRGTGVGLVRGGAGAVGVAGVCVRAVAANNVGDAVENKLMVMKYMRLIKSKLFIESTNTYLGIPVP
jgi:hypothetical protein